MLCRSLDLAQRQSFHASHGSDFVRILSRLLMLDLRTCSSGRLVHKGTQNLLANGSLHSRSICGSLPVAAASTACRYAEDWMHGLADSC
jgi:hypothetical protein